MTTLPFTAIDHPNTFSSPSGAVQLETDVCVIGSGAGGAVMAAELAEGGMQVALLEKGPYVTRKQMNQRERDMIPLLFEDAASRTTKDGGMVVLHAHCVGGTTVVNNAICFDPPAWLLEEWAKQHGVVGISERELAPSVAKVNFILNVQEIVTPEINANAQVMLRGAKALNLSGKLFRHNRTGCLQSGFCVVGCSYDRKQNMHITYVPRALSFGARLYPETQIELLHQEGKYLKMASGFIRHRQTRQQFPLSVKAKLFVVCGGAISTPALLLANAIANSSGQVGKNLYCHPTAPVLADMGDEVVKAYQGIPQVSYLDDYLRPVNGFGGFLLESIFAGPSLSASFLPRWGKDLHEQMAHFNHFAAAFVQIRDEEPGRIWLDPSGIPVVDYALDSRDAAKIRQGYRMLAELYLQAGARVVHIPHSATPVITKKADLSVIQQLSLAPAKTSLLSAHQMGTCRMGEDPRRTVVDSRGKAHDLENLYIADASVFPTAIGLNPQITVASIATHFARQLLRDRSKS
ncbi:MAG: GMC family oxidoreductase [Cyanobacteria bacterium NC_groundwater_1444_Ag_S-0.65um_54_12]|nr:GMC family oxidoreductase [Cyanobacteria bacterium NC_groundwater_1444_Ag_S-0.65um_54_12]